MEELCDYLGNQELHQDVIAVIEENRLTGMDFVELSSAHLKELFPVLGTRMAVQRLVASLAPKSAEQLPRSTLGPTNVSKIS